MPHRRAINAAFDKVRPSLDEVGLSSDAKQSFERIRDLFMGNVYTEVPSIQVFPSRKQIKIYCSNASQEEAECDGSFEATIEHDGAIMLISKCLEASGCVHTKQWLIPTGQKFNDLDARHWLEYVRLPEPIDVKLVGKEIPWEYLLETIDLAHYDGPIEFYARHVISDRYYYARLCNIMEMSHTRYYDLYEVPMTYYAMAKIKHSILGVIFKIAPDLITKLHAYFHRKRTDEWYEKNNSFPDRWFKKVAWTKF